MRKIYVILIVLFSLSNSLLYAQFKVIHFGKLIDDKGKLILNAVVIVKGDRIVRVGTENEIDIPPAAETIDLKAYTAIPGLIDAHTHMTFYWDKTPGTNPWGQLGTLGPAVTVFLAQENARKTLETGVTTVRDLGSFDNMDFAMRNLINRGAMEGPRMFVAGNGLHISSTPYKIGAIPDAGQCDGVAAVQRVAREQIAGGADWIKMYGSTGSDKDVTVNQTFTYDEMKAAADVAHFAAKKIAIHLYGKNGVDDAIRAGTNSIEHAIDIPDTDLELMSQKGIFYVPTIEHNNYYIEHKQEYGYDSSVVNSLTEYIGKNFETLKRVIKANVKILMGSDAVFTGFGENTNELKWFVKAGMTPLQALQTATINGAEMLGLEKQLGQLSGGYFADIVAVEGDPTKDINVVIKNVKWVMKGGNVVVNKTNK